jgi:hypothetical protein
MSPITDPRYAASRREQIDKEQSDSAREARMEYIKPLIMLLVGIGSVITWHLANGDVVDEDGERTPALGIVAIYLVVFVISLVCGVIGLWLASKLWLGGVGYLGLSILRLAGIYAITDLVGMVVSGLPLLGWFIKAVVYVSLLMWLFELEATESIMLALITFVVKVAATIVVMLVMFGG